jgi:hypothetical protein
MFFSQATGFNTVLVYAKLIFIDSPNLGAVDEDDAMGITAGLVLLSGGLAIGLSKVVPRRILLLSSAVACCITLTLLGLYYYHLQLSGSLALERFAWVPLAALLLLIVSHMCGYGAVAWTVIVEILPGGRVRSQLFPLVVAFNCVCNFGFALSFGQLEQVAGYHVVFWLHAALTALGVVVVACFVPETRNRTEQEIAGFFRSSGQDNKDCCCSVDNSLAVNCCSCSCDSCSTHRSMNDVSAALCSIVITAVGTLEDDCSCRTTFESGSDGFGENTNGQDLVEGNMLHKGTNDTRSRENISNTNEGKNDSEDAIASEVRLNISINDDVDIDDVDDDNSFRGYAGEPLNEVDD